MCDVMRRHGLTAWTRGRVPFRVTSSCRLAWGYADVVFGIASSFVHSHPAKAKRESYDCYVVELGAGHCAFGFRLAQRLHQLCNGPSAPRVCVVLTDASAAAIDTARRHPCFRYDLVAVGP